MSQYKLQIMTINKQHYSWVKFLCHYVEKMKTNSLLHVKTKSYMEAVLFSGGSFTS